MSGIAGIYFCDGRPVERASLERMAGILSHRGPDRVGTWCEGSVGFLHRMLWTTPESLNEKLPLANSTGDLVITADARIDNREELAAALGLADRLREGIADSELILLAYEKWGEGCVDHLLGDFAFAIWDGRRQILFCARDHMGVKPFYYYSANGIFVFGSEIKAILTLSQVPRRVNDIRIAEYLTNSRVDKETTFFSEICCLAPAHTLRVSIDDLIKRQYWALNPSREIRFDSDAEYEEAYREIFTEAVRCRLRSAFPVGSLLSGGLDSSSIVVVARDLLAQAGRGPLKTFSAVFDRVKECDERPYIEAIVAQGGLESHYHLADDLSPLADFDGALQSQDEPMRYPTYNLHRLHLTQAAVNGCRVLLDGWGGDQVVSYGWEGLAYLARSGQWRKLRREATLLSKNYDLPLIGILAKHVVLSSIPRPISAVWRSCRQSTIGSSKPASVIGVDLAKRIGRAKWLNHQEGDPISSVSQRGAHWMAISSGANSAQLGVHDRSGASVGLEGRFPFVDKRVAEFCLALPAEQKLGGGWLRSVPRRSFGAALPGIICGRTRKTNFSAWLLSGFCSHDAALLQDRLLDDELVSNYVDLHRLRSVLRASTGGDAVSLSTVFRVLALSGWLRRVEGQAAVAHEAGIWR